jgi:sugar lactone lactonase YvrE
VFVSRFEYAGLGCNGYVSILDAEGKVLREIATPAPEVTGITVGGDQRAFIYITEQSTSSVYRIALDDVFAA